MQTDFALEDLATKCHVVGLNGAEEGLSREHPHDQGPKLAQKDEDVCTTILHDPFADPVEVPLVK